MTARRKKAEVVMDRVTSSRGRTHPRVRDRVIRDVMRRGIERGVYNDDRKLSLALKRERDAFIAEMGGEVQHTALVLIDALTRTKMLLDTIDLVLIELGSSVINRRRKYAYKLLRDRQELADSLANQLRTLREFKTATDIERRLEALEDREREGHTYDAQTS
jgi:hypothetical protein